MSVDCFLDDLKISDLEIHLRYVIFQDEVDEDKNPMESSTELTVSDSLSIELCSAGNKVSCSPLLSPSPASVVSKDSMLADRVGVEDSGADGSFVTRMADEETNWFGHKPVISEESDELHDGLDMAAVEDCSSAFNGVCNTIDFDTIIDLGLKSADVMSGIQSRGQSELLSVQSDSISQSADSVICDLSFSGIGDIRKKDALCSSDCVGIQLGGDDVVDMKTAFMPADVPSCAASNMPQLSSLKCEVATSFLTPKTPTHSQGLPTYTTHFLFSVPDVLPSSPVSVARPKTPVVSVSLPVCAQPQLSPQAPYTPDTPSVFQFPSPNQSPASSTGSPAASRHTKRHTANFHPYCSPSASTSSPRYLTQQQASAHQLDQQKRLEMEVAEAHSEIDHYIRQLQHADMQQRQQLQSPGMLTKDTSKLTLSLAADACSMSDTSQSASSKQTVSPIEEVIQILVAEHFGVTVPSKSATGDQKCTISDSAVRYSKSSNGPISADGSDQHVASEEFRNPGAVLTSKPRKRKPEPLVIPASVSNFGFRSQLRSPKLFESGSATQQFLTTTPPPYTPPPMISPVRTGSGLFWTLHGARHMASGPLSAPPCHSSFPCMCDAVLCCVNTGYTVMLNCVEQ